MSWATAILDPEFGIRFYVQIQGLPQLFCQGAAPVAPDGTTWAGGGYTWVPHSLDATDIEDRGAEVSRVNSSASPATMSLTLLEDRAGTLMDVFAWDRSDGKSANLTASVAYDTVPTGTVVLAVDAHTFAIGDNIWLGRECLEVTATTATTVTCDRDLYSLGGEDARYVHLSSVLGAPRVVTDWPRVLVGRYVRLHAYGVDRFGRALDAASGGSHSREVWRGFVSSNPLWDNTWHRMTLPCVGLESMLRREVGGDFVGGALIRVPGNAGQNKAGSANPPAGMPWPQMTIFISEGTERVHVKITESDATVHDFTGPNAFDLVQGSTSEHGMAAEWKFIVGDVIYAATATDKVRLGLKPHKGGWRVWLTSNASLNTKCEIFWAGEDSVGPLLGFEGTSILGTPGSGHGPDRVDSGVDPIAVYIAPWATKIPFYYVEASGQTVLTAAPSSGYARIGSDDVAEIVSYTSVASLGGATGSGMYELRGVKRARMGTRAKAHVVLRSDIESVSEETSITFGVGWEYESPIDVILEMAQSTGGGHRSAWDTLPETVGAALNPAHFDGAQMAEIASGLSPALGLVSLFIAQPQQLGDLASDLLSPLGVVLQARGGSTYALRAVELLPPLESATAQAIGEGLIALDSPGQYKAGNSRVINRIAVSYQWDAANEKAVEGAVVTATDRVSRHDHGDGQTLDWTLVGRRLSAAQALALVSSQARTLFALYGQPYDVLDLPVSRAGWLVEPGDTISLTLTGIPTSRGSRGVTARLCTVLSVAKTWAGSEPGAVLRVLLARYARQSTYVPSASVISISGAAATCAANAYTETGTDASHFEDGDVCWIYPDYGDAAGRVQRTVLSVVGSVITFTAAIGFAAGSYTVITGGDYTAATSAQKKHVHIASSATPPVLSVATAEAFRYV